MRSNLLTSHYGLITDCLSEFCRDMRKKDFTTLFNKYFRLNSDFNQRDEVAVRKTFSGLAKLIFPDENMTKEDVRWLLEYAIEGRRRVKEQLKIMAGVEFIDVNLGYIDADNTTDVRVIAVPEQSDGTLIPDAPLMAGHAFGVGQAISGEMAVYKLENRAVDGDFKFEMEGIGSNRKVRDTMEAAFKCFEVNINQVALGARAAQKDYLLFYNDLQGKGPSLEVSLAEYVGLCSAALNRSVLPALAIPGIVRLSGTMDPIRNLEDIWRVAKNAGAKKILLPLSCIKDMQTIPDELVSAVSPEFYEAESPVAAAKKALGL